MHYTKANPIHATHFIVLIEVLLVLEAFILFMNKIIHAMPIEISISSYSVSQTFIDIRNTFIILSIFFEQK